MNISCPYWLNIAKYQRESIVAMFHSNKYLFGLRYRENWFATSEHTFHWLLCNM